MGEVIAIVNQKGGVGKTTTTINLSGALAVLEKKVLVIDADPQANSTSGLGFSNKEIKKGTYQILSQICTPKEATIKVDFPNLFLIPSHIDLVASEIELVEKENREQVFKNSISNLRKEYDYILIDCAPSLGLITLNALTACNSVIVPIQCEYYALEGLGKLLNTIITVQRHYNKILTIRGLLLTMYDSRLRLSNQVVEEVREHFPDMVFDTLIHRNIKLGEAPSYGKTIIGYAASSIGAKNYLSLANELLKKND